MTMDRKEKNSDNQISNEVGITRFVGGFFIITFIILFIYGGKHLLNPNTFPIKHVKVGSPCIALNGERNIHPCPYNSDSQCKLNLGLI